MAKFDSKVDGNTVGGDEYNNIVNPLANLITSSGQTIDTSNTQVVKAIADYAAVGTFYSEGGVVNAYSLSAIGNRLAPNAYSEGMEIRFRAGNANTGATTVNVAGLGVKSIKQGDGSTDLTAGDISTDFDTRARYDGTVFRLSNVSDVGNLTVNGKFNTTPVTETISSEGAITYSGATIQVNGEGGAADVLTTINGGSEGDRVLLRKLNTSGDITVEDGTGNIYLEPNENVQLGSFRAAVELSYINGEWKQVSRSGQLDFKRANLTNGYQYLPSGLIMQWGQVSVGSNTTVTVTLPITFTYNNRGAYTSLDTLSDRSAPVQATILSNSQIQVRNSNTISGTDSTRWWCIGF